MSTHPYTRLFTSASAPTVDDDIDLGYEVEDLWLTATTSYQCLDNSNGAAIWLNVGGGLSTEQVQDLVGDMFIYGSSTGHTVVYDDTAGTVSLANEEAYGWAAFSGACSYGSADAPVFTMTVAGNMTLYMGIGDRVKLTQSATVKYFIIHDISFSGGNTTITLYGGTDYTLANSAISDAYYSHDKSPLGFPMNPAKWTVTVTDTSNRSQASPVQNTWYNLGSVSISVPIGAWKLSYFVIGEGVPSASNSVGVLVTLSTANNSQSNAAFTRKFQMHLLQICK